MFDENMSTWQTWQWRWAYIENLFWNYPSAAFFLGWAGVAVAIRLARTQHDTPAPTHARATPSSTPDAPAQTPVPWDGAFWIFFAASFAALAIWSMHYYIWDMYAFGLPVWILFATLVTLGTHAFLTSRRIHLAFKTLALATIVIGPLHYQYSHWTPPVAGKTLESQFFYVTNLWDPRDYFGNPNKRNFRRAEEIADALFAKLPRGAYLIDDDGKGYYPVCLYYQEVKRRRPDLRCMQLFGPFITPEKAARTADEVVQLLNGGHAVFISSPYWPERLVLNALYYKGANELGLGETDLPRPEHLDAAELEKAFPKYQLNRIQLIDDQPFFIYEITLRQRPRRETN